MFSIFNHVLEAKGLGWSVLRYALILAPAVLALIVLSTAFRLDWYCGRSNVIKLTYLSHTPSQYGIAAKSGDANCEATMSSLGTLMFALYVAAQVFAVIFIKKWNAEVETIQGEASTPAKLPAPDLGARAGWRPMATAERPRLQPMHPRPDMPAAEGANN